MPRAIVIEPEAKADLAEASKRYESDQDGLGQRFLGTVHDFLSTLVDRPAIYQVFHRNTCSVRVPRFPYLILYRFDDTNLYVLAVMHGARDPSLLRRRAE